VQTDGEATVVQLNMLRCHVELRGEIGTEDWRAAVLWLRLHGIEAEVCGEDVRSAA
jgi:hypothetical protein